MWASVSAAKVDQQNAVNMMQIDMLQLGVLQTMLDNLSLQSTLLLGAALGMWAGATLKPLLEDESQMCIWKSGLNLGIATVFFVCVALTISCCMLVVSVVSYIKQYAQEAALIVSTGAAVAVTRLHLRSLNRIFVVTYTSFGLSAVLLIVLFVGMPARIPYVRSPLIAAEAHAERRLSAPSCAEQCHFAGASVGLPCSVFSRLDCSFLEAHGCSGCRGCCDMGAKAIAGPTRKRLAEETLDGEAPLEEEEEAAAEEEEELEYLVDLFDGSQTITCIDPRDPIANERRTVNGACIAGANSLVILAMSVIGFRHFRRVQASYEPLRLLNWFVNFEMQQKSKQASVLHLKQQAAESSTMWR